MRKLIAIAVAIAFVSVLGVPAVFAGSNGQAGKSNTAHLYLYQKYLDPDDGKWYVYPGGAWGKMTYYMSGTEFWFVMNGHDLAIETDYTLIYYPDPWPGLGLMCLGTGTTDDDGDVTIEGMVNTGNLPAPFDLNANPFTTTYKEIDKTTGAKIWLVLSKDVDCGARMMTGWTISEEGLVPYLFEKSLINFVDTDGNVEMLNLVGKYGGLDRSGILTYNLAGPTFDFAFDAQGLVSGTGYTLIYFKDFGIPWNGCPVTKLASGVAGSDGMLHLANSMDLGMDLVDSGVASDGVDGAKIWLVTTGNIDGSGFLPAWNPALWLFEDHGIFYDDTNAP